MKRLNMCLAIAVTAAGLAACSGKLPEAGKEGARTPDAVSADPVTLSVFVMPVVDDVTLKTMIEEPIRRKYPNISLKFIKHDASKTTQDELQALVVSGSPPDIIYSTTNMVQQVTDLNLQTDLTPLIQKHKFDLGMFDTGVVDIIRQLSPKGELYGLPLSNNASALYYNKDIFDKFGVAYPKDGMTWDEATELARKVTRTDNGSEYRGLMLAGNFLIVSNSMSLMLLDPKTDQALINGDKWKSLFETWKRIFEIPGNEAKQATYEKGQDDFLKSRNIAMFASYNLLGTIEALNDPTFKWDVVSLPAFKEAPKMGSQILSPLLIVSSTTKYKDQSFLAVAELFTPEAQKLQARAGQPVLLKDQELKKQLGQDLKTLQGKNVNAFFVNQYAPTPAMSKYELVARKSLMAKFKEYVIANKDVNTILREMEEAINKEVAMEKSKK